MNKEELGVFGRSIYLPSLKALGSQRLGCSHRKASSQFTGVGKIHFPQSRVNYFATPWAGGYFVVDFNKTS